MNWLSKIIDWLLAQSNVAVWIGGVSIILVLTALAHWIWRRVDLALKRRFDQSETVWDDALLGAIYKPITLSIWLVGLAFAFKYVFREKGEVVDNAISMLRDVGIVFLLGWFLLRLSKQVQTRLIDKARESVEEDRLDETTVIAIGKLARVSIFIITSLILLQTAGFSISGVLAFGGIGGLAVSFAAKDMLANFFGGFVLYLDRPFVVGDSIRSPDREVEGSVEYIGWRITRIRTLEKRALYVPNATFTTISVENITRMTNRRIRETIGLRYDDKHRMKAVIADIRDAMRAHPELVNEEANNAYFVSFGASSLDIMINALTTVTDWTEFHRVKQDVLFMCFDIIHRHGADVAFPTQTLYLQKNEEQKAEVSDEVIHGAD